MMLPDDALLWIGDTEFDKKHFPMSLVMHAGQAVV